MMDEKKIAFIACVNDELEFSEALSYIEELKIPEGYQTDVIAVREAPSMAAGYQAAMASSDAKYKIYLHQDTFLIYPDMLKDLIEIFQRDETIGMIGTIGSRMLPQNAHVISKWDTGRVYCNGTPKYFAGYEPKDGVCEVMAVDGMFMATQYDFPWREDLFDAWDFYDLSQSCEFIRKGKKVVVPRQKEYWTFHDNKSVKLQVFNKMRIRFIEEYQDIHPFVMEQDSGFDKRDEYEQIKVQGLHMLERLIDEGNIEEVCQLMKQPEYQGFLTLKEIELICNVYSIEQELGMPNPICTKETSCQAIYMKLNHLRHLVKRVEFSRNVFETQKKELVNSYSPCAVLAVVLSYGCYKRRLAERILEIYRGYDDKKYREFAQFKSSVRIAEQDKMADLMIKESNKGDKTGKNLVVAKSLEKLQAQEVLEACDKPDYDIIIEKDPSIPPECSLNIIKNANVLCGNALYFVMYYQDKIYQYYQSVDIYGEDMEDFVRIFYRTQIPVVWHISEAICSGITYSANIQIQTKDEIDRRYK